MKRERLAIFCPVVGKAGVVEADFALARKYYRMILAEYDVEARSYGAKCALARMDRMDGWQWSEAAKLAHCRQVVDNSGDPAALAAGADRVLATLAGEPGAVAHDDVVNTLTHIWLTSIYGS